MKNLKKFCKIIFIRTVVQFAYFIMTIDYAYRVFQIEVLSDTPFGFTMNHSTKKNFFGTNEIEKNDFEKIFLVILSGCSNSAL